MKTDNISKVVSLFTILIVTLGAVTVYTVDSIIGRPIPDIVSTFMYTLVGTMIGYTVHSIGVTSGSSIVESTRNQMTSTDSQLPIVKEDNTK